MLAKIAFGNVRRSLRDFSVYFLSLVFGICVFYAFNSITQQSAVLDLNEDSRQVIAMLSRLIGGVSVFVAVVLGLLVVYANQFLIRRRKREFGIYLTLGMSRGQVSLIVMLEALIVGVGALAVGLLAGILLSQIMLVVTAHVFAVTISGFSLVFSPTAALATLGCFLLMFAVTLLFNVRAVSCFGLIDLINADKVSEKARIRSLPVCVVLFVVSLALIGVAYHELIQNGMLYIDSQFRLATLLVSVGTLLFFFSLSGFLLRAVQSNKRLYLRGLNMFSLRQLNSRINSAWLSISIVCAALFLAITSTCGGFAIADSMNQSIEERTPFDASFTSYTAMSAASPETDENGVALDQTLPDNVAAMDAVGGDMVASIRAAAPSWDEYVEQSCQIDRYSADGLTGSALLGGLDVKIPKQFQQSGDASLGIMGISQLNAALRMQGKAELSLADGRAMLVTTSHSYLDFWCEVASKRGSITIAGEELSLVSADDVALFADTDGGSWCSIVVPDSFLATHGDQLSRSYSVLDVTYRPGISEQDFLDALEVAFPTEGSLSDAYAPTLSTWPYFNYTTATKIRTASVGISATIAYVAIYIGFVLLVSCASILAIQQLSAAADNVTRYRILRELGAERLMIDRALLFQVAVYFVFPLALALAHSFVALGVIKNVVETLGMANFMRPTLVTGAIVLALYGGYFWVTYETSRGIVERSGARRE